MTLSSGRIALFFSICFIGLPIASALVFGLIGGEQAIWDHIVRVRLVPSTLTTLSVLGWTAILVLSVAIPAAWLVSLYEFPGRHWLEWALILPLAMPGYVMAYAWSDLVSSPGPLQHLVRDLTGLSARDYWFPSLSNAPGLAFVMAATLFPYVYLTARAAFTTQSAATLNAARSLGASGFRLFWSIALPAARPAIVAGLALVLMESAADYGAADFLGVRTLGKEVVLAWSSSSDPSLAARLALMLVLIAFAFLGIERMNRGQAGAQHTSIRWSTPARSHLSKRKSIAALLTLMTLFMITFVAPISRLLWLAFENGAGSADLYPLLLKSVGLGLAGMFAAFLVALPLAVTASQSSQVTFFGRLVAAAGYAAPGAVLALGGLFILSGIGGSLTGFAALAILVWVYACRFATVGAEPMIAATHTTPRNLGDATRSLGVRGFERLWRVDLPILLPGAYVAGLILFVETLKELPATLMLRPTGWDTLAVKAHAYASDGRLAEATLPSLLITLAGLAPVILLSRQLSNSGRTE